MTKPWIPILLAALYFTRVVSAALPREFGLPDDGRDLATFISVSGEFFRPFLLQSLSLK